MHTSVKNFLIVVLLSIITLLSLTIHTSYNEAKLTNFVVLSFMFAVIIAFVSFLDTNLIKFIIIFVFSIVYFISAGVLVSSNKILKENDNLKGLVSFIFVSVAGLIIVVIFSSIDETITKPNSQQTSSFEKVEDVQSKPPLSAGKVENVKPQSLLSDEKDEVKNLNLDEGSSDEIDEVENVEQKPETTTKRKIQIQKCRKLLNSNDNFLKVFSAYKKKSETSSKSLFGKKLIDLKTQRQTGMEIANKIKTDLQEEEPIISCISFLKKQQKTRLLSKLTEIFNFLGNIEEGITSKSTEPSQDLITLIESRQKLESIISKID